MSKKSGTESNYFVKRQALFHKYLVRGMRTLDKAENVLLEDYARSQADKDLISVNFALGALATFQIMLGRNSKAEKYLRDREERFPDSLEAKLAIARYFGDNLRDYRRALRKLREVRLRKNPSELDFDTYYNTLNLKGVALLHLRQPQKAVKVMAELAKYTEENLSRILFFFDLHFVELMIERKLALQDCRSYLKTLRRRKQVIHDQKKTISLLRRANRLLG